MMNRIALRFGATFFGALLFLGTFGGLAAWAVEDCELTPSTPYCVAEKAGTQFKVDGFAALLVLIPLAIALIVAVRAWLKAKQMVHL